MLQICINANSFAGLLKGEWEVTIQSDMIDYDPSMNFYELLANLSSLKIANNLLFLNDFPVLREIFPQIQNTNCGYELCFTLHDSILYTFINFNSSGLSLFFKKKKPSVKRKALIYLKTS